MDNKNIKIVLPGGAGLVGQNLVDLLVQCGFSNIVVIDKSEKNLFSLRKRHPTIQSYLYDLSKQGEWKNLFIEANVVVMLQAQIGGKIFSEFIENNIHSTSNIIDAMNFYKVKRLIHISSSVINSLARDFYSNTKREQESMVLNRFRKNVILRPTLMFGHYDNKHLGWLSKFMKITPIFPIPGSGNFKRQPLYVKDFCKVILSCIKNKKIKGTYNISGIEFIDYIDLVKKIRDVTKTKVLFLKIPFSIFKFLLYLWQFFDKSPPFTVQQLEALVADDKFDVIDWPKIFNISQTSIDQAIYETFFDSGH